MRRPRGDAPGQQEILDVIADENAREAQFEARVIQRVTRDAQSIVQLPERQRGPAIQRLLDRERRYARQRSQAMAMRALGALDVAVLRGESPTGAFWRLGNTREHTPDCLYMARYRFWPWEALRVLNPPTHTGCKCSLHSYQDAIRARWMLPSHVQDLDVAMRRVAAARAMLHEEDVEELRAALIARGMVTEGSFDTALFRVGGVAWR